MGNVAVTRFATCEGASTSQRSVALVAVGAFFEPAEPVQAPDRSPKAA
jgi:hypothetical protein